MDKHLHLQVFPYIEVNIFVDSPCITVGKVDDLDGHSLFVELLELRVHGVLFAGDTRRQNVVYRTAICILLDVHRRNVERSIFEFLDNIFAWLHERIVVFAPFAANKVKSSETKAGCSVEVGHEDSHETYRLKIGYRTDLPCIFRNRNFELIPRYLRSLIVGKSYAYRCLVGNIVLTDN